MPCRQPQFAFLLYLRQVNRQPGDLADFIFEYRNYFYQLLQSVRCVVVVIRLVITPLSAAESPVAAEAKNANFFFLYFSFACSKRKVPKEKDSLVFSATH